MVDLITLNNRPPATDHCCIEHAIMVSSFRFSARSIGLFFIYISFNVGSAVFNKYLFDETPFPFPLFTVFFYTSIFALSMGITGILSKILGRPFNIKKPKEVPVYIHAVALIRAASVGLWMYVIHITDVSIVYALGSIEPILYIVLPALCIVKYKTPYQYTRLGVFIVIFGLVIFNTLTLAMNPNIDIYGIMLVILCVSINTLDAFLCMRLNLDDGVNTLTIAFYTTMESVVWLFGLAFLIDIVGITDYYGPLSKGFSLLSAGTIIEAIKIVSTFYVKFELGFSDRMPYMRQWLMLTGVCMGFAVFGAHWTTLNYVGLALLMVFSSANEYINRGRELDMDKERERANASETIVERDPLTVTKEVDIAFSIDN